MFVALVEALDLVIDQCRRGELTDPWESHAIISSLYNWRDVTRRTEAVYDKIVTTPTLTDGQRMQRYLKFGRIVGPLFCLLLGLARIILWICEKFAPKHVISLVSSRFVNGFRPSKNNMNLICFQLIDTVKSYPGKHLLYKTKTI